MSFFVKKRGFYLRRPDGGIEDIANAKAAGFSWVAIDLKVPRAQWQTVEMRALEAGLEVIPWMYPNSLEELEAFAAEAEQFPACILNLEKQIDDNVITPKHVLEATAHLDVAISTEPWLYTDVEWELLSGYHLHLQLFPQENTTSWYPVECRRHAYSFGFREITFMLGIHDLGNEAFCRQGTYSVFVADDVDFKEGSLERDYALWSEEKVAPIQMPYTGPLYGPSVRKTPANCKTVKALKIALHRLGFGVFTKPDTLYNRKLEDSMKRAQALLGFTANGQFGKGMYEYFRIAKTPDLQGLALTGEAIKLIKADAIDG